jgi:hypothetical protein
MEMTGHERHTAFRLSFQITPTPEFDTFHLWTKRKARKLYTMLPFITTALYDFAVSVFWPWFINISRNDVNLNSLFITLTPSRCYNLLRALIICALSIAAKLTHCRRVTGAQEQEVCLLVPCQNADVTRNSRFYVCGVWIKDGASLNQSCVAPMRLRSYLSCDSSSSSSLICRYSNS